MGSLSSIARPAARQHRPCPQSGSVVSRSPEPASPPGLALLTSRPTCSEWACATAPGRDRRVALGRVAPTGIAYGLDVTDEMLALARTNQAKAGVENVHWLKGHIEAFPLPAARSTPRSSTSRSPRPHRVHAYAGSAIIRARKPG